MKVLVPLLTGKEAKKEFIDAVTSGASKVILLQIIDKSFMNKTSTAMGEVMQFSGVLKEAKKAIGAKKKPCEETTEWGDTIKKIVNIASLQQVDKIYFVKQKNRFFDDILKELDKEKLKYELIEVIEEEPAQQKRTPRGFLKGLIGRA